jgi:hypothetical protein
MQSKKIGFYSGPDYMTKLHPEISGSPPQIKSSGMKYQSYVDLLTKENEESKIPDFGRWTWEDYITLSYC